MSRHGLVLAELPVTPSVESSGDSTFDPSLAPLNTSPPTKVWFLGTSDSGLGATPPPPPCCRRPAGLTGGQKPLDGEFAVASQDELTLQLAADSRHGGRGREEPSCIACVERVLCNIV